MAWVEVDADYCKGCGLCVDVCSKNIMELDMKVLSQKGYHPAKCIDQQLCTGCLNCAIMCPDVAIKILR